MNLREAAEQALEALRYTCDHLPAKSGVEREVDDAITALQVALAQPEQEPVAWHEPGSFGNVTTHKQWAKENGWMPLYTAPPKRKWVGLTDQEIENLWNQHESRFDYYSFSCDIEAKLKDKNT